MAFICVRVFFVLLFFLVIVPVIVIVIVRMYIPGSCTMHALIGMFHNWSHALDGTGDCVGAFVLDYKKAFDLIDHSLLMAKLLQYDINPYIINWIAAFLSKRQQRVKTRERLIL